MTLPYDRIRDRIDRRALACMLCGAVEFQSVVDHCHEHGWTRGVLCVGCNNRMARVDADLSLATVRELFHRDNCPDCRREGYTGILARAQLAYPATGSHVGAVPGQMPRVAPAATRGMARGNGSIKDTVTRVCQTHGYDTRTVKRVVARELGVPVDSLRDDTIRLGIRTARRVIDGRVTPASP